MAAKMAIALVVVSVVCQLAGDELASWVVLSPYRVFHQLALWQPLTYGFVELSPLGILFSALIIWQMGGSLEYSWGPRRLLAFSLGVSAVAGLVLLLVAALAPALGNRMFAGEWVLAGSLWVAYGLYIGRGQANFWGIPTNGNGLALIGIGLVLLNCVFRRSLLDPSLFGIAATVVFMRGHSLWLTPWRRFQSWRLQRQIHSRSKHLRVIGKDGNPARGSDRYLH